MLAVQAAIALFVGAVLYRFFLRPPLAPRLAPPVRAAIAAVIAIGLFALAGGAAG